MRNWKQESRHPLLKKYIDCYWLLEKSPDDISLDFPKLNPDPAAHFILAPAEQTFHYQFQHENVSGLGCHLILPNTNTLTLDHSKAFIIVGIKFHVGALYGLKGFETLPLINQILTQDHGLPLDWFQNSTSLFESKSEQKEVICQKLDSLLIKWIKQSQNDKHSQLVQKALTLFKQTDISQMGEKLHCAQRTIERSFKRVTGLSLKQYANMVNFEELLDYLHQQTNTAINWVDVAAKYGFSDQPHLIRQLKNTIGRTPGNYIKQRDLTIDVYGNFE